MEVEPIDNVAKVQSRTWAPASWRNYESLQMATYDDQALYAATIDKLSKLPPLVQAGEVDELRKSLAAAARGESFIIQGGDCAERFIDCEQGRLDAQLKVMVQMGALLEQATGRPCVRIARIAGQYGKPRSKPTETYMPRAATEACPDSQGHDLTCCGCLRVPLQPPDHGRGLLVQGREHQRLRG